MKLSYRNYPILRLFDQNCYKQVKFRCDLENLSEVSNEASRNNLLLVNQVMNMAFMQDYPFICCQLPLLNAFWRM